MDEMQIKRDHQRSLFGLCKELGIEHRSERLAVIGGLVGRKISSFNDLTEAEWRAIRDEAWPDWFEESERMERWTLGTEFRQRATRTLNEYNESIGQLRLPV